MPTSKPGSYNYTPTFNVGSHNYTQAGPGDYQPPYHHQPHYPPPNEPPPYQPPPYEPPPHEPPPTDPGEQPPSGSSSLGLGLQVGLDVNGALDGTGGLLDVTATNNGDPLINASVDGTLDEGIGGVITVEAPALGQDGGLVIDVDAAPAITGGDGALIEVTATNDGDPLLTATVDPTDNDGTGGVVTVEAPALGQDGGLVIDVDAAAAIDGGDGSLLEVTATNDGDPLLNATVDGTLDDGLDGVVTVDAPVLGQNGALEVQVDALQDDADLSVGVVSNTSADPQNVVGPIDLDLSDIVATPVGSATTGPLDGLLGGDGGAITDDIVSGVLGNLGSSTPLLGGLLGGDNANLLQAVTGDLVGDALSAVGGGSGLPDAGTDLLGAILSTGGDSGAITGIDIGHTLDMLTSAVDLFDVPALDGVLDGTLSA